MSDKMSFVGVAGVAEPVRDRAAESPWRRSSWADMLTASVTDRHAVSGMAYVSPSGMLAVPYGENSHAEVPLANIGGASFVPSPEDFQRADMFAFVRGDRKLRISEPKYMGTFAIDSEQLRGTEKLLEGLGVGVSKLFNPK
jgi:hypothetical protein